MKACLIHIIFKIKLNRVVLVFMLLYCSLGSCNKAKETKHNWGRQMEARLDAFTHMPATAISTKQSICSLRNNRVHRVLSHNGYNIIFMAGFILSESEACVLTPSVTSNSLRLWSTFTIRIKAPLSLELFWPPRWKCYCWGCSFIVQEMRWGRSGFNFSTQNGCWDSILKWNE